MHSNKDPKISASSELETLLLPQKIDSRTKNFDHILDEIGMSPLQVICVLICGLGNAADGVEILSIGYVITQLNLSGAEQGALSGAVFAGMLLGSLVFGTLSDKFGRRITFILSTGINFVAGVLFAAAGYFLTGTGLFAWLIIFRFIAGFGVGGCMPIVFPYAAELLPAKKRGLFLIGGVAAFWMMGSIYTAGFAWWLIGYQNLAWPVFSFVCAIPAGVCVVLTILYMPESPRYLMVQGRTDEVTVILQRLAKSAGKVVHTDDLRFETGAKKVKVSLSFWEEIITTYKPLVSPKLRRIFILQSVVWFCMNFGWYGLILWFPVLFEKRGIPEESAFAMAFYVAAANLPGNILSALLSDVIGRRWLLAICMFLSSGASIAFIFTTTQLEATLMACLFNFLSIGAWNALDCLSSEQFPTYTRSVAIGVLASLGRIGSLIAQEVNGILSETSTALVLIVACGFMLVGAFAAIALPETAGEELDDFNEAE